MTSLPPPGTDDPLLGPDLPDLASAAEIVDSPQGTRRFWRSFLADRWAVAGLTFLVLIIAAAIFAPLIAPYNPSTQDLLAINAPPSLHHLLGTDDLGRDILSRIIWGGRVSLRATFEIVILAIVVALPLGLVDNLCHRRHLDRPPTGLAPGPPARNRPDESHVVLPGARHRRFPSRTRAHLPIEVAWVLDGLGGMTPA